MKKIQLPAVIAAEVPTVTEKPLEFCDTCGGSKRDGKCHRCTAPAPYKARPQRG